jgi:Rrf2 family cysteine metabolism transcriptional repressor
VKLTTRSEYALLALICLARHDPDEYISGEKIAAEEKIPINYLQQIMLTLRTARYVQSLKGQRGGYKLAKKPDQISVAEIIRIFDGSLAPTESASHYFYESTPVERENKLLAVFKEIRNYIAHKLETTTISDVCNGRPKAGHKPANRKS